MLYSSTNEERTYISNYNPILLNPYIYPPLSNPIASFPLFHNLVLLPFTFPQSCCFFVSLPRVSLFVPSPILILLTPAPILSSLLMSFRTATLTFHHAHQSLRCHGCFRLVGHQQCIVWRSWLLWSRVWDQKDSITIHALISSVLSVSFLDSNTSLSPCPPITVAPWLFQACGPMAIINAL